LELLKIQEDGRQPSFKLKKSQYLTKGLTDCHEIWQGNAYWPPPYWQLKSRPFENPRWRTTTIMKTEKSQYLSNNLTDLHEIWHGNAHWPLHPTGR